MEALVAHITSPVLSYELYPKFLSEAPLLSQACRVWDKKIQPQVYAAEHCTVHLLCLDHLEGLCITFHTF